MNLAGYSVLVEKGRWVDEERLHHPAEWDAIIDRLSHLIQNQDYPAYTQRNELKRIRRIRLHNLRIYCCPIPTAKILTVLAVVVSGYIKRDEKSGALDYNFIHYLTGHSENFQIDRFIPLEKKAPRAAAPIHVTETAPVLWSATYDIVPLTEQEAIKLLAATRPSRGRYASHEMSQLVMRMVERAFPEDKIVVPLPDRDAPWEREEIYDLQNDIRRTMGLFDLHYSVSYDEFSQKIVLVPPGKKAVYLSVGRGHRVKTRWDLDTAGRV